MVAVMLGLNLAAGFDLTNEVVWIWFVSDMIPNAFSYPDVERAWMPRLEPR